MRERIIEILTEENRKMNPVDILGRIQSKNTADDLRNIIDELDAMCRDGILRTCSGNSYFFNDLTTGVLDVHSGGSAHVLMSDGEDIFIRKNNLKGACDGDTVSIEMIDEKRNEGKVVKVLKRSLGKSFGQVIEENGEITIKVFDELPYKLEFADSDITLVDGMFVHFDFVRDIDKNRVLVKVDKVLGHVNGLSNGERNSETAQRMIKIGCEFGRSSMFPPEVLEEAKQFKNDPDPEEVESEIRKGVSDLRGEVIITIDGKDTKDIDDAVSNHMLPNGNFYENTDIADVSRYVKMGSAIWKYAEEKGNSDYWGNKVAPMLPVELSNGICSLNQNKDRFAVTVDYELDHSGKIINPNVYLSVIKSKKKMNYDAVQDIIDKKYTEDTKDYVTLKYTVKEGETIDSIAFKYAIAPSDLLKIDENGKEIEINKPEDFKVGNEVNIPTRKVIDLLYKTSKIQGDALRRRGKTDFDKVEPKYEFDENDNVIGIKPRVQRESERIIENKMIYANEAFAQFMVGELSKITTGLVPFVFRTHGNPNPKKIQEFLDMLKAYNIDLGMNIDPENITSKQIDEILDKLRDMDSYRVFSDKLLRCMQKAAYTHENYGHFGINSPLYTHFTSPIRRMCDLLVHTLYRVFCEEKCRDVKELTFWGNYLDTICEKISECEVNSEKCEYAQWDMLNALMMQNEIGKVYEGLVDGLLPSSFFVRADNLVEGRVDFYMSEAEGEELMKLTDQNEILQYIEEHKKYFSGTYDYNDKMFGYSRNGKMYLRLGDRVKVVCIGADPDKRQVDFALVRKL